MTPAQEPCTHECSCHDARRSTTIPPAWTRAGTRIAAAAVTLIGALMLAGWLGGIEILKGTAAEESATSGKGMAMLFMMAGIALWLLQEENTPLPQRRGARLLAAGVALTGAILTALFVWHAVSSGLGAMQGYMALSAATNGLPVTAFAFLVSGLALLCLPSVSCPGRRLMTASAVTTLLVGFASLAGHVAGISSLDNLADRMGPPVSSAALFMALGGGILAARPRAGIMALVTADDAGGLVARHLFTAGLIAAPLLGWLRLVGEREGLYGTESGLALFALSNIVILAFAILSTSQELHRMDAERDRACLALEKSRRSLEESNRELEAFTYSVSHDLRAPLRAIEGFSLALDEDCGTCLDATGKDYLARIRGAVGNMARLIEDMLGLSRVIRAPARSIPVNLSVIARSLMEEIRRGEPSRRAELTIEDGLTARGDPELLKLALENLLRNAWKFTARKETALIEFSRTAENGRTAFRVRDNGAGFDMKYAGKLFGPFQRLHAASDFEGTGVGLSIVQRIIRRHGGEIRAEGKVGEGAAFYFTLGEGENHEK